MAGVSFRFLSPLCRITESSRRRRSPNSRFPLGDWICLAGLNSVSSIRLHSSLATSFFLIRPHDDAEKTPGSKRSAPVAATSTSEAESASRTDSK